MIPMAFGQISESVEDLPVKKTTEPAVAVVRTLTTLPARSVNDQAEKLAGRVTSIRATEGKRSREKDAGRGATIKAPGLRRAVKEVGSLPTPPAWVAGKRKEPARIAESGASLTRNLSGLPPLPQTQKSTEMDERRAVRPAGAWMTREEVGTKSTSQTPATAAIQDGVAAWRNAAEERTEYQRAIGEQAVWQPRSSWSSAPSSPAASRRVQVQTVSGPRRMNSNQGVGSQVRSGRQSILEADTQPMRSQPSERIAMQSEGLQILPDSLLQSAAPGSTRGRSQAGTNQPPASEILPDSVNEAINSRYQNSLDRGQAEEVPVIDQPQATSPLLGGRSGTKNNALDDLPDDLLLSERTNRGSTGANDNALIPGATQSIGQSPLGSPNSIIPEASLLDRGAAPQQSGGPNGTSASGKKALKAPKYSGLPEYINAFGAGSGPHVDVLSKQVPYEPGAFLPSPMAPKPFNPAEELNVYRGKFPVPVQRPLVEWWRPLFGAGLYPPAKDWFGRYNLVMPHFMVYGDFRTAGGVHRLPGGDFNSVAVRANLDMDLELTATERIHAFLGPLDRGGEFTHLDFTNGVDFVSRTDVRLDTLFFEGDAGAIWGGLTDQDAPFDLPFSLGLIPFFYQNGIWAADAAVGAAVALPARHSKLLKWSNYDATFFWASDQVNTDAFPGDNNAAEFFGTAWFIEAYDGYFEVDYAFVHDDVGEHRSYHNFSVGFTKRYFHKISNSIRLITNFDQALPRDQRTAEGHLLLIENALITSTPNTFVPYANFFYGQGRVQSLARAGVAGGILNNTGINFESDGLTGYPTLDASGTNTVGGAVGINLLGHNFNQQLMLEVAGLAANGSPQFRNAPGDQYAVGMRYQRPITNAWIFRTDHMLGFRRNAEDIRGSRVEMRFKF
ncbi:MAG: hypothetical protein AB8B50_21720 [Pirellulaceae bacterium]